jgi:uncharacterized protein (TIGR00251 family)
MRPIHYSDNPMSIKEPAPIDFARAVTSTVGGTIVEVWAVPGASKTEIAGLHGGALRIRVAAPPERGKANRALEKVLSAISGTDVELIRGPVSRRKSFFVKDVGPSALAHLIAGQAG